MKEKKKKDKRLPMAGHEAVVHVRSAVGCLSACLPHYLPAVLYTNTCYHGSTIRFLCHCHVSLVGTRRRWFFLVPRILSCSIPNATAHRNLFYFLIFLFFFRVSGNGRDPCVPTGKATGMEGEAV